MTSRDAKRNALSNAELECRLGPARLAELSLAQFGGVMMTEDVFSGHRTIDRMFRQEPDQKLPFSGWVFLSGEESPEASADERGLRLHDCLAVLRIAPEVAAYLNLPPGTELVRTSNETFEPNAEQ
jgi:hypothetical protein